MDRDSSRISRLALMAGALSLVCAPASAAGFSSLERNAVVPQDLGIATVHHGRHGRHYDRGPDAGDVVVGLLFLGALAAIAGRNDDNIRERDIPAPPQPINTTYRESGGISNAIDMCVDEVAKTGAEVDSVDEASRRADGWHVTGIVRNGEGFSCWIDNDGRVRAADLGGASFNEPDFDESSAPLAAEDNQFDDAYYAQARERLNAAPQLALAATPEGK